MISLRTELRLDMIYRRRMQGYSRTSLTQKPNPHLVKCDYVGPPDKLSNLRPYVRCISNKETNLAKTLRLKCLEVEEWNQQFWSQHNKRYYTERDEFIKVYKLAKCNDVNEEGMSKFYKDFLQRNKQLHIKYNIEWYKKNLQLLALAFCVALEKLIKQGNV